MCSNSINVPIIPNSSSSRALTEANAQHANIREAALDVTQSQEEFFHSLLNAGNNYPLIEGKLVEGLSFYRRLHGNMIKLRDRVKVVLSQLSKDDPPKSG